MVFEIEQITWGFVVPRAPVADDHDWLFLVAPDLAPDNDRTVNFCRVRVRSDANSPPQHAFVLTPSPQPSALLADQSQRAIVRRALLEDRPSAHIAVLRASGIGFAEVEPLPRSPGALLAAAVAVSKATGPGMKATLS